MRGRSAAVILSLIAIFLGGVACTGGRGGGLRMTFDVNQRPPEPPAPPQPPEEPPAAEAASDSGPAPLEAPSGIESAEARKTERILRLDAALKPACFETGRWDITPEALVQLEAAAALLREAGDFRATVEGHADERGSDSYNYVLGIWRAKAVKDRLRALGVDPSRLTIMSHGKKQPAATGTDRQSLARNRRVEIVVRSAP